MFVNEDIYKGVSCFKIEWPVDPSAPIEQVFRRATNQATYKNGRFTGIVAAPTTDQARTKIVALYHELAALDGYAGLIIKTYDEKLQSMMQ